jgi:tetratricopeptide (TPR) repeat protein
MRGPHPKVLLGIAGFAVALAAAYSNHFGNGFHFDDFHTVQYNPAIRSLANLPSFFTDAGTFSIKPAGYRPIVTTSLAIDYALAGGLRPLWFHISTFLWFLVQLALMYVLYLRIFEAVKPAPRNQWLALTATALYGLHPASAETVNYIVQRGDLYSTLGIIAAVVLYAQVPASRRWGLYMIPALLAMLAKPTALVFAPILLTYIILFDRQTKPRLEPVSSCFRRSLPAFAACGLFAYFEKLMTPAGFLGTTLSSSDYWITQPYVALRYFRSFFLPLYLTADTDLRAFDSVGVLALVGFVFVALIVAGAIYTARRREWRPVSFGLWWFLLGILPTAIFPLAEVENDHRMFMPFVGLSLAVVWAAALLLPKSQAVPALAIVVLVALSLGTYRRNAVWFSEEALWRDVTEKSPGNPRGLLNYGFALLEEGDGATAYSYFRRASTLRPNYFRAEENMGIAAGAICRDAEAEEHFRTALRYAPADPWTYIDYAGWLLPRGKTDRALQAYQSAFNVNPTNLDPLYGLMEIYARQSNWNEVLSAANKALSLSSKDPIALAYSTLAQHTTSSNLLDTALAQRHAGKYEECIRTGERAIAVNPDSAEAYIEIARANQSLGRWDQAIEASRQALRIKPAFAFALKDLAWSLSARACPHKTVSARVPACRRGPYPSA